MAQTSVFQTCSLFFVKSLQFVAGMLQITMTTTRKLLLLAKAVSEMNAEIYGNEGLTIIALKYGKMV